MLLLRALGFAAGPEMRSVSVRLRRLSRWPKVVVLFCFFACVCVRVLICRWAGTVAAFYCRVIEPEKPPVRVLCAHAGGMHKLLERVSINYLPIEA